MTDPSSSEKSDPSLGSGPSECAPRPGFMRRHAVSLILTAVALTLVSLLRLADRDLGPVGSPSPRYRFHAIPVAISQVYHGRVHDYTANRQLALRFQNTKRDLDGLIAEMIATPPEGDTETYYWAADDRGLSDYVAAAFRLFGPNVRSLSRFYFVILLASLGLFAAGYWRSPGALLLPVCVLFGALALAHILNLHCELPSAGVSWQSELALYDSRLFDLLALVAFFHLALLAVAPPGGRSRG